KVEVQDGASGDRDHQARLLEGASHIRRQDCGRHDVGIGACKYARLCLSIEGQVDRDRLALFEMKIGAREAEQPGIAGVLADDQNDAVAIGRRRRAMRESTCVVVGEGAASPVADMDVAVRPLGVGDRGDRELHKKCEKESKRKSKNKCFMHTSCPQPLTASFYVDASHESNRGWLTCVRRHKPLAMALRSDILCTAKLGNPSACRPKKCVISTRRWPTSSPFAARSQPAPRSRVMAPRRLPLPRGSHSSPRCCNISGLLILPII